MCFAIGAAIVFIVLSNSGPSVPVQVLDTKAGPTTPPPQGMDIPTPAHTATGQSTASHTAQNRPRQEVTAPPNRPQSGVAGPVLPARAGQVNDVELLTEPPGAKIVVDGRPDMTCSAPCTLSLPNGRHTLTAELAGYNIARRIFNLPSDNSMFVNLGKSMGVVVVTSSLSGCTVLVDGQAFWIYSCHASSDGGIAPHCGGQQDVAARRDRRSGYRRLRCGKVSVPVKSVIYRVAMSR